VNAQARQRKIRQSVGIALAIDVVVIFGALVGVSVAADNLWWGLAGAFGATIVLTGIYLGVTAVRRGRAGIRQTAHLFSVAYGPMIRRLTGQKQ
jgi:hypothetical protein